MAVYRYVRHMNAPQYPDSPLFGNLMAGIMVRWMGTALDRRAETVNCIPAGGTDLDAEDVETLNRLTADPGESEAPGCW